VNAQDFSRKGKAEVFLSAQYATGDSTGILGGAATLDFGSFYGGGIGFGYNVSDHVNLNADVNFGSVESTVHMAGSSVESDALLINTDIALDYNVLKSRLTPLLTVGFGVSSFSDEVSTPRVFLEYTQPTFSLGGGAGVRWDMTDHLFLKAVYRAAWHTGLDEFDDNLVNHTVTLMFGFKF